jgi:hypothetical protein
VVGLRSVIAMGVPLVILGLAVAVVALRLPVTVMGLSAAVNLHSAVAVVAPGMARGMVGDLLGVVMGDGRAGRFAGLVIGCASSVAS